MDREGQLDDAEVGAEVPAARGAGADQLVADLTGEGLELGVGEVPEVGRRGDLLQQSHPGPFVRLTDPVECRRDRRGDRVGEPTTGHLATAPGNGRTPSR